MDSRIPFLEAIGEPLLFKAPFDQLSPPQRVALKAFYGCPLSGEELTWWSLLQGHATYDPLGYPLSIEPVSYTPREYERLWAVIGRRSGKSSGLSSFVVAYESTLGGHEDYLAARQEGLIVQVAQDLKNAHMNLGSFIRPLIEGSPILKTQIVRAGVNSIELKNRIVIAVAPPKVTIRGHAIPVAALDEVGIWYKDADSANPDYEVERAIRPAQAQFPFRKLVATSTPWTKEGLLHKYWLAGTDGGKLADVASRSAYDSILVLQAPTAAMQNPRVKRSFLQSELVSDAESFEREYLARFVDSISSFIPEALVRQAIQVGVKERPPQPGAYYIAALDPAFRRDAFGFMITHPDPMQGVVLDVVRRWKAEGGEHLNPLLILGEIHDLLLTYNISLVASDQYQLESLNQLAMSLGFTIEGVDFTARSKARIFGNLRQLLLQRQLALLDHPELVQELILLERRITSQGAVQVNAPPGKHDDLACALGLAAKKASELGLYRPAPPTAPSGPTLFERCSQQIAQKRIQPVGVGGWD